MGGGGPQSPVQRGGERGASAPPAPEPCLTLGDIREEATLESRLSLLRFAKRARGEAQVGPEVSYQAACSPGDRARSPSFAISCVCAPWDAHTPSLEQKGPLAARELRCFLTNSFSSPSASPSTETCAKMCSRALLSPKTLTWTGIIFHRWGAGRLTRQVVMEATPQRVPRAPHLVGLVKPT